MRRHLALVVVFLVVGLACNKTGPSNISVTGTWSTTAFTSFLFGKPSRPFKLTLNQAGTSLTGNWLMSSPTSGGEDGTVTGTMNGTAIAMTFNWGPCGGISSTASINGTVSGSTMTLNSGGFNPGACAQTTSFSMTLTKQ